MSMSGSVPGATLGLGLMGGSLAAGALVATRRSPFLAGLGVVGLGVAYLSQPKGPGRDSVVDLFLLPALVGGAAVKLWKAVR